MKWMLIIWISMPGIEPMPMHKEQLFDTRAECIAAYTEIVIGMIQRFPEIAVNYSCEPRIPQWPQS